MAAAYMVVSRLTFACWWFILLLVHALAAGYNMAYAIFYIELDETYLNTMLEFESVGMPSLYHRRIAVAFAAMSALHTACLLLMIVGSLWHRSLRFTIQPTWLSSCRAGFDQPRDVQNEKSIARAVASTFHILLDRNGIFGVDGTHFHNVLVIREMIEMVLQTIQVYRMSKVLPRISVNRTFVILLVLNCFAPLIAHHLFKNNEPRKRFANLVCDCFLDLAVGVGMPMLIVLSYVGQYDPDIQGFSYELWFDNEWSTRVQNEFQLVLIVSWMDLFSRIVFTWGVFSTTTSMKEIIANSTSGTKIASAPSSSDIMNSTSLLPPSAIGQLKSTKIVPTKVNAIGANLYRQFQLKRVYYVFVAWGLVVLGFHVYAEMRPPLPQCALQVRPWGRDRPLCYLIDMNCHQLEIQGFEAEVYDAWNAFDGSPVVSLLIRHCPMLEIPPFIQNFHNLSAIKIYNSTLIQWESGAAVTGEHHPKLTQLHLIRVNMTYGEIPHGLLSRDFPPLLTDFEIVMTNLHSLPDDLDQIWPLDALICIEFSNLTTVPGSLVRLQSYFLSIHGNPITELPAELFELESLLFLDAGRTLISELPRNVTMLSTGLLYVSIVYTNVSSFWSWIDPLVEIPEMGGAIIASGSPYCDVLELYWATGGDGSFVEASGTMEPASAYSFLMNLEENATVIEAVVLCEDTYATPFYSLVDDDLKFALSPVELPTSPMN